MCIIVIEKKNDIPYLADTKINKLLFVDDLFFFSQKRVYKKEYHCYNNITNGDFRVRDHQQITFMNLNGFCQLNEPPPPPTHICS